MICNIPEINTKCVECVNYKRGFCRGKSGSSKPKFFSRLKNVDEIYRPAMEKICSILKYFPHQKISFKTVIDPACPQAFSGGVFFRNKNLKEDGFWKMNLLILRGRGQKVYKCDGGLGFKDIKLTWGVPGFRHFN